MSAPVLLCPPGTVRDEWLAARRQGIGASEIAAVLGISPYDSPFSLFWKKAQGWQTEDNPHMEAGRRLEDAIAGWAIDRLDPNENLVFTLGGLYASAERSWQLATPDRLAYLSCPRCGNDLLGCPACQYTGRGDLGAVLEVKHPGSWDDFGDDGTDDIPVHYRCQLLQQMDVMEVATGYLAAYCNHDLRIFQIDLDDSARNDLDRMREDGAAFWQRVTTGDIPDVDGHSATLATLRRLHPSVEDIRVDIPADLAEEYRAAKAAKTEAQDRLDAAEARLRAAMGPARRAVDPAGQRVVTRVVTDVAERTQTVAAHTRDYLLASKPRRAS